ncbi:AAA family ATPase [bacterium]|nr:AAA family ATPase [bacterium]
MAEKVQDRNGAERAEALIVERPDSITDPLAFWLRRSEEDGYSASEIAQYVGYDESTVSKILNGKYQGNVHEVLTRLEAGRSRMLGTSKGAKIRTDNVEAVGQIVRGIQHTSWIVIVHGEPGVGKTTALRSLSGREGGIRTAYLTVTEESTSRTAVRDLAAELGVDGRSAYDLRRGILEALRVRPHVIVVDEMNNLSHRNNEAAGLINTLRQINDEVCCGLVLCGTTGEFYATMTSRANAVRMEMCRSRVHTEVHLGNPTMVEHRALLQANFGPVSDQVWRAYEAGLNDPNVGNGKAGSFRRATQFMDHARRVVLINGAAVLTEEIIRGTWRSVHIGINVKGAK